MERGRWRQRKTEQNTERGKDGAADLHELHPRVPHTTSTPADDSPKSIRIDCLQRYFIVLRTPQRPSQAHQPWTSRALQQPDPHSQGQARQPSAGGDNSHPRPRNQPTQAPQSEPCHHTAPLDVHNCFSSTVRSHSETGLPSNSSNPSQQSPGTASYPNSCIPALPGAAS